jgi:hypothetical protein
LSESPRHASRNQEAARKADDAALMALDYFQRRAPDDDQRTAMRMQDPHA